MRGDMKSNFQFSVLVLLDLDGIFGIILIITSSEVDSIACIHTVTTSASFHIMTTIIPCCHQMPNIRQSSNRILITSNNTRETTYSDYGILSVCVQTTNTQHAQHTLYHTLLFCLLVIFTYFIQNHVHTWWSGSMIKTTATTTTTKYLERASFHYILCRSGSRDYNQTTSKPTLQIFFSSLCRCPANEVEPNRRRRYTNISTLTVCTTYHPQHSSHKNSL